jgi:hypothetical protein
MATKSKKSIQKSAQKSARKTSARKSVSKAATRRTILKFDDKQKIKVVGEHNRRDGSRYFGGYETLRKTPTVAAFRNKRPDDAQELLRNAVKDGYIKIA